MAGQEDYKDAVLIQGNDGTNNVPLKVDVDGQMYTLMVGKNGRVVALDDGGNMKTLMYGTSGGVLVPLAVDAGGRMVSVMDGDFEGTATPLKVSESGVLQVHITDTGGTVTPLISGDAMKTYLAVFNTPFPRNLIDDGGGRLKVLLCGMDGTTARDVAVDADGKLKFTTL